MVKTKELPTGFVLIEVAIALFVLALVLGGILGPINQQLQQGKIRDTQKAINDINDALYGFVMINGRLPRPAISSTNGAERVANCTTDVLCTGYVPWAALGVNKQDAWGNLIRYSVSPTFADNTFGLGSTGTKIIQERDTNGVLTTSVSQIPVVIWSNGPENFGVNEAGVARANSSSGVTNADEITNNAATVTFIKRVPSSNPAGAGGEFDDIVTFIPTAVLINKAVAAGKLP
jgi:type II secretory pathway pseudopilin PulG